MNHALFFTRRHCERHPITDYRVTTVFLSLESQFTGYLARQHTLFCERLIEMSVPRGDSPWNRAREWHRLEIQLETGIPTELPQDVCLIF